MRNYFSKITISQKFILSMLSYALVPLLLLVAGLFWSFNYSPEANSDIDIQALACSQASHLETQLEIIENLQFQIRNNPAWINLFNNDSSKSMEAEGSVRLILQQSEIFKDTGLAIYAAGNHVKQFGNPEIPFDQGWLEELSLIANQEEITWRTSNDWIYAAQMLPESPQLQSPISVIGLPIDIIKSNFEKMPFNYGYSIINSNEEVVYHKNNTLNETSVEPELNQANSRIFFSKGEDVTMCINQKAWQIIIFHPAGDLINKGNSGYILIIGGFISLILIVILTWIFYRKYLKPVKNVAQGLNAIRQQNLDELKPLDSNSNTGEMGDLIKGYNDYLTIVKSGSLKEKALRQSEERFGLAIRGANDGIWDWDLIKNFCYYSPRWRYMLGYTEESVRNTPSEWFTRVHPDDIDELKSDMNAHLEGNTPYFENEHRLRHMNGTYIWVLARGLAVRDNNGKAYRFAGSVGDISKRKAYESQLLKDAMHDPLTNLPNNAYFKEALSHSLSRMHRREDYYAAVLLIDL